MFVFVAVKDSALRSWVSELISELLQNQNVLTIVQTSVPTEEVRPYSMWAAFSLAIIATDHLQHEEILASIGQTNPNCYTIVLTQEEGEKSEPADGQIFFNIRDKDRRQFAQLVLWLLDSSSPTQ